MAQQLRHATIAIGILEIVLAIISILFVYGRAGIDLEYFITMCVSFLCSIILILGAIKV